MISTRPSSSLTRIALVTSLVLLAFAGAGRAQMMGMPDARAMSGIPRPDGSLPDGTVSVRVVRAQISDIIVGQAVELSVNGTTRTAKTDETGHAKFPGLPVGATVRAAATIEGRRIESQEFQVPSQGGVVLMLAAAAGGVTSSGAGGAKPVPGAVTFGGESRVMFEVNDDVLQVYYLLDIMNAGQAPVTPPSPIVFDLPAGAESATVLEGSSPQAVAKGSQVTVAPPFQPGVTPVQIAYVLPIQGDRLAVRQKWPAALQRVAAAVQKVGDVSFSSPQFGAVREVTADGRQFVAANGPEIPAGGSLDVELSGLPHRNAAPRWIALALAVLILGGGVWGAASTGPGARDAERRELEARRDSLFAALVRLDADRRAGRVSEADHGTRRPILLQQLERLYGELDTAGPAPGGAGEGLAR